MIDIQSHNVRNRLQEALAARGGDFVYKMVDVAATGNPGRATITTCAYVSGGKPSCLVGFALHHLGIEIEDLDRHNTVSAQHLLGSLAEDGALRISPKAAAMLMAAQHLQDKGQPWRAAYMAAEAVSFIPYLSDELPEPSQP